MNLPELKLCFNHLYHRVNPLHALHGLMLAVWPQEGQSAKLLVANPAPEAVQHLQGHLEVDSLALTGGQLRPTVTLVTESVTLSASEHHVVLVQASAPVTLTLPADAPMGTTFVIKDQLGTAATHAITLEGAGADTFDGQGFVTLEFDYERVTVMATGTGWALL